MISISRPWNNTHVVWPNIDDSKFLRICSSDALDIQLHDVREPRPEHLKKSVPVPGDEEHGVVRVSADTALVSQRTLLNHAGRSFM